MLIPSILLSIVIGSLIGSIFHVFAGGGRNRLLIYILVSCAGFFAGHFIGIWRGWLFIMIGVLDAGFASLLAILCLGLAYTLEKFGLFRQNDKV